MGFAAAHTCLCQIPCRTPVRLSTASRVEPIPRFQRMVGARRAAGEGREGREWLGAQLPANTRAHSISPCPSDAKSHCPALTHIYTHTSPPCHLPYPPLCLSCSSVALPCSRYGGPKQCRKLLGFICSTTDTHTHTHTHTPLVTDSVTARGV